MKKAAASDFSGRFREVISDPLNLLIRRVPEAGTVQEGQVVLHNGHRVALRGPASYYDSFSDILVFNRGVHEPLEEFAFQEVLAHLPATPVLIELGAYWAHYSMWMLQQRPQGLAILVEPDPQGLAAGQENFRNNGYEGRFEQGFVGRGAVTVDGLMTAHRLDRLDILHSDIQGKEMEMLEGAGMALKARRIDYLFVSTHSQNLHNHCRSRIESHGYRIEISADYDNDTTSYDGFLLACRPELPQVIHGGPVLGRSAILNAAPQDLLADLARRIPPTAAG